MSKNNNINNSLVESDALHITSEGLEGPLLYGTISNHIYIEGRKEAFKTKIIELLGDNVEKAKLIYDKVGQYNTGSDVENFIAEVLERVTANYNSDSIKFAGFRTSYVSEFSSSSALNDDVELGGLNKNDHENNDT